MPNLGYYGNSFSTDSLRPCAASLAATRSKPNEEGVWRGCETTTIAAALLLCCGLGALYWIVVRHAFEEDNDYNAANNNMVRGAVRRPSRRD